MYNTPPCWAIYMCGLVFNHMLRNGGIEAMKKTNDAKAKILYDAIDNSDGFYVNPIAPANRSNMNVPFTIPMSQELEAVFVKEAAAAGMVSKLPWLSACSRAINHALMLLAFFVCCSRSIPFTLWGKLTASLTIDFQPLQTVDSPWLHVGVVVLSTYSCMH